MTLRTLMPWKIFVWEQDSATMKHKPLVRIAKPNLLDKLFGGPREQHLEWALKVSGLRNDHLIIVYAQDMYADQSYDVMVNGWCFTNLRPVTYVDKYQGFWMCDFESAVPVHMLESGAKDFEQKD